MTAVSRSRDEDQQLESSVDDRLHRVRDRLTALADVKANVYLATADEADIVGAVEEFVGVLRPQLPHGIALEYHPMPTEFHDTGFRAAVPRALRRLFGRRD